MTQSSTEPVGPGRTRLAVVFVAQLSGLAAVGWLRRHALNPDGVAYVRIAGYYLQGRTDLAVSGYWGPLLSWLMTPWLAAGIPPLAAARIVMGLSAVVFLLGCLRVFRAFGLSAREQLWGVWLAAALSVCWSVEYISPDLLAAGLIGFGFCSLLDCWFNERPRAAWLAGAWWGLAYLAKAAALPLALLVTVAMAAIRCRRSAGEIRRVAAGWLKMWLCVAVIAGSWVAILSAKYHHLTISRSATLNHAMVGPPDTPRFYPLDRGLYVPEPGRVTFWEDPDLPYPDWSPLASASNAGLQLLVIAGNLPIVLFMLSGISLLAPWAVMVLPARLLRSKWRHALAGQRWPLALLPVASLGLVYVGGNLLWVEQRYFYAAFPFLFVAGLGMFFSWKRSGIPASPGPVALFVVAMTFLAPTLMRSAVWRRPSTTAGECAWVLADKLSSAGISGPVAGSAAFADGRAALYVAFYLGQPWVGYPLHMNPETFQQSRARIVVVNRGLPIGDELGEDSHFVNLDGRLFGSADEAQAFPVQAFELIQPGAGNLR